MNNSQYKLLKYGYKRSISHLKASEKLKISEDKLHLLLQEMQDCIIPDNGSGSYSDSSKGEEIHERRQREKIRFTISVLALISSLSGWAALIWQVIERL